MGKSENNMALSQLMEELNKELSVSVSEGLVANDLSEDPDSLSLRVDPLGPATPHTSPSLRLVPSPSMEEEGEDGGESPSAQKSLKKPIEDELNALIADEMDDEDLKSEGVMSSPSQGEVALSPSDLGNKAPVDRSLVVEGSATSSVPAPKNSALLKSEGVEADKSAGQLKPLGALDNSPPDKEPMEGAKKDKVLEGLKNRVTSGAGGVGHFRGVGTEALLGNVKGDNIPLRTTLNQSENLRVAQEHIIELEAELERLRKENEELIATGDIFTERLDKVRIQNDELKKIYEESREEFQEEKKNLLDILNDQRREIEKANMKNKELEKRLSNNIRQIRVRERELENRLELMKLDSQTLVREKDQYILDLKRKMDRIKMDMETQKNKHDETEKKLENQRNQSRRAAKGLQMALNVLKDGRFAPVDSED